MSLSKNSGEPSSMNVQHVTLLVSTLDYIHLQDCITMLPDYDKVTPNIQKPCRLQLWRPAIGFSLCGAAIHTLSCITHMSSKKSVPLTIEAGFKRLIPYIAILLRTRCWSFITLVVCGVHGCHLSLVISPCYHLPPRDHGRILDDPAFPRLAAQV